MKTLCGMKKDYPLNPVDMKLRDFLFDRLIGNFIAAFIGFVCLSLSSYVNGESAPFDSVWPVIIGITLGCFWAIRLHAYREAERIKYYRVTKKLINHRQRLFQRGLVALAIGLFIHLYVEGLTMRGMMLALSCALYIGGLVWLLFDPILSVDRGLKWNYISRWYKSAFTDRIFKQDVAWWVASKVLAFYIGLALYYRCLTGNPLIGW